MKHPSQTIIGETKTERGKSFVDMMKRNSEDFVHYETGSTIVEYDLDLIRYGHVHGVVAYDFEDKNKMTLPIDNDSTIRFINYYKEDRGGQ